MIDLFEVMQRSHAQGDPLICLPGNKYLYSYYLMNTALPQDIGQGGCNRGI